MVAIYVVTSVQLCASRTNTCPQQHCMLELKNSSNLLQVVARRKHSKITLVDPDAIDQQQRHRQQHAFTREAVAASRQRFELHASTSATAMLAEEAIPSLNATEVLFEAAELEAKPHRLWAHGADFEGIQRTSTDGRSSTMVVRVWPDMRGKAENGLTIAFFLAALCLLAMICFIYAGKQTFTLHVEETHGKENNSVPGGSQPVSFQRSTPSTSRSPQTPVSRNSPWVKHIVDVDSFEPPECSALPMRSNPPRTTAGSVVPSLVPALRAVQSSLPANVPTFCPGFVVPDRCECVMLLPRLVRESGSGDAMITGLDGTTVIKAVYCFPNMASDGTGPLLGSPTSAHVLSIEETKPCLILAEAKEDTVFATCWRGPGESMVIQDGSNELFGSIVPQTPESGMALKIMTPTGLQMHVCVCGDKELKVTDHEGCLVALALTDAISAQLDRCAIRVGALTDAGLVVLALLAFDLLKSAGTQSLNCQ